MIAAALVSAVISLCTITGGCETHQLRLERKMCGVSSTAEVPINGEWVAARARVTCAR